MKTVQFIGYLFSIIGLLGLIATFLLTLVLMFASAFCGTAPHGCDQARADFWGFLVGALNCCIFFIFLIVSGKQLMK
jgi:hypothetical protein